MTVFDSNAILRYILQDNEEMADLVEEQLGQMDCFIPIEVVAEIVYVLNKVYSVQRQTISSAVLSILNLDRVETTNYDILTKGLEVYSATKLDFVDCLMSGYQSIGYRVFTFDKALRKYLEK